MVLCSLMQAPDMSSAEDFPTFGTAIAPKQTSAWGPKKFWSHLKGIKKNICIVDDEGEKKTELLLTFLPSSFLVTSFYLFFLIYQPPKTSYKESGRTVPSYIFSSYFVCPVLFPRETRRTLGALVCFVKLWLSCTSVCFEENISKAKSNVSHLIALEIFEVQISSQGGGCIIQCYSFIVQKCCGKICCFFTQVSCRLTFSQTSSRWSSECLFLCVKERLSTNCSHFIYLRAKWLL